MKGVFTLVLMLVLASILITSCSQISNTALTKTHNQNAFYTEPGINLQTNSFNEEINSFPEKGFSSVQTELAENSESVVTDNIQASEQNTAQTKMVSTINDVPVIPVVNEDIAFLNSEVGKSKEISNEYLDISTLEQTDSYSNHSDHHSSGVPFILIFLCAFFIPPLGVALMFGITDKFWICLGLTLLLWLPGMIYAMIQIFD